MKNRKLAERLVEGSYANWWPKNQDTRDQLSRMFRNENTVYPDLDDFLRYCVVSDTLRQKLRIGLANFSGMHHIRWGHMIAGNVWEVAISFYREEDVPKNVSPGSKEWVPMHQIMVSASGKLLGSNGVLVVDGVAVDKW